MLFYPRSTTKLIRKESIKTGQHSYVTTSTSVPYNNIIKTNKKCCRNNGFRNNVFILCFFIICVYVWSSCNHIRTIKMYAEARMGLQILHFFGSVYTCVVKGRCLPNCSQPLSIYRRMTQGRHLQVRS